MPPSPDRFQSLDVLRGMTLALMIVVNMSVGEGKSYAPLLHARWDGLTLTDLVFPSFLFAVGAALGLTLGRYQALGTTAVLRKVATRSALIFLCGYLLSWFPFFELGADGHFALLPLAGTRIPGVLQRIALAYGSAALIIHFGRTAGAVAFSIVALLGYWWILQVFGDYSLTGNAVLRLDLHLFGAAHLYHGEGIAFDPEGALSTLPAVANVIAGFLACRLVRDRGANERTIAVLLLFAAAAIVVALLWNNVFPINKKLWTSSYALCGIGIDLAVLAALIYVLDVRKIRGWTPFFEILGRNTLFIYVLSEVLNTILGLVHVGRQTLFEWLYESVFAAWAGYKPGSLLYAVVFMLGCWSVAYLMDREKIYVKL
jgi:predicted acyltransferase